MNELKDNTLRGKHVLVIFTVLAVVDIISVAFGFYQNSSLTKYLSGEYDDDFLDTLDMISLILGVFYFLCFAITVIIFIRWFRRAYGNLLKLNIQMEYTENGAVWGYFIPFINWVRPIKTMKEIYLKLQDTIKNYDSNFSTNDDTSFIALWWIIYLINGFIGNYASRVMNRATTLEAFIEANKIYIFSDFFDIIAVVIAIFMVLKVSKLELTLKRADTSLSIIDQIGTTPVGNE